MSDAPARPTILLVDDEADILVALGDLLDEDYDVLSSTSPARALTLLEGRRDVAVILSDQRMPEMPGNVFLAHARALCDAEALLLSGYADIDAVISAINDGRIGGYAHKPWDPDALRAMIAAAAERHRLRRALGFEQALFAALVETSRDRIGVLDATGAILRGDPALAAADGAAADRIALDGGEPGDEELRSVGPDGAPRYRRVQRFPVTIAGTRYLLKIESDESERRALKRQLQQAEKLQALGTLAGGIAHDFNNLLTAVLGNLELAAGRVRGGDERIVRYVENARNAAKRGAGLTKRLLSFSRQGEIATTTTDPNALIAGMEDLLARTTGGSVSIRLDLATDAWPVRIDGEQLELAILNLAINARDAMPGGGVIAISTRNETVAAGALAPGDYVAIAVADAGSGMTDEVAARVFEPFFTTKERGRGTGLGLPMVHALADNAGGRAELVTAPGKGTIVTIRLPRDAAARLAPIGPAPAAGGRILLVEDDDDVRAVSRDNLDVLGHQVLAVASADEALAVLERDRRFDAVLTDFAMPGLSGLQLAQRIGERWPGLPVVIVSGFAEVAVLPPGVVAIRKPFTAAGIAAALAEARG